MQFVCFHWKDRARQAHPEEVLAVFFCCCTRVLSLYAINSTGSVVIRIGKATSVFEGSFRAPELTFKFQNMSSPDSIDFSQFWCLRGQIAVRNKENYFTLKSFHAMQRSSRLKSNPTRLFPSVLCVTMYIASSHEK